MRFVRLLLGTWIAPIPLRILFAAHPGLLTPVLRIIHRVIARFLLKQAGLKRSAADTGDVILIQHFTSPPRFRTSRRYVWTGRANDREC